MLKAIMLPRYYPSKPVIINDAGANAGSYEAAKALSFKTCYNK